VFWCQTSLCVSLSLRLSVCVTKVFICLYGYVCRMCLCVCVCDSLSTCFFNSLYVGVSHILCLCVSHSVCVCQLTLCGCVNSLYVGVSHILCLCVSHSVCVCHIRVGTQVFFFRDERKKKGKKRDIRHKRDIHKKRDTSHKRDVFVWYSSRLVTLETWHKESFNMTQKDICTKKTHDTKETYNMTKETHDTKKDVGNKKVMFAFLTCRDARDMWHKRDI